jgi:hypothetical protein
MAGTIGAASIVFESGLGEDRDFLDACESAKLDNCGISESTLAKQATSVIAEYHAFPTASEQIHARQAGSGGDE